MGVQRNSETRFCKGTVSIHPYKQGVRLRWRHDTKRQELYVPSSVPQYQQIALAIQTVIEQDLIESVYDGTLVRYKDLVRNAALLGIQTTDPNEPINASTKEIGSLAPDVYRHPSLGPSQIIHEFDRYLLVKNRVNDTNYYALTRKALVKWGVFDLNAIPELLSQEKWSAKTFNDRRSCLYSFCEWLKRKNKIPDNPLADSDTKERERMHPDREPFSDGEGARILLALKTNQFVKSSSRYTHSQYYPFVAFLLHVGCRPGEAIGLKVRYVNFEHRLITIGNSLSRTLKGTHASARIYKSTKNMKVRHIPMDAFLFSLLEPLCQR